ncbi:MAG: hypothetical protein A3F11_00080 [Gammaproteobacteria bacterium RIFCSPHIGHO2_12_FULL_37_14]|nr:MAG: hypothetical protein A3F11_00080 [Gammaproteobacteria bacterium RIFCSPHIGHO2_12_FULL_37_14]
MKSIFSRPVMVGLDIQTNGIHLISLKKSKHTFFINHVAAQDFGTQPIYEAGKIKYWDALTSLLADLVKRMDIQGMPASINLPANLVHMQRIQLPIGISDQEIESEIYANNQRDWPSKDRLFLDFSKKLSKATATDSLEIFFALTYRDYLSQYIDCVCSAGLQVKVVDVDIYTWVRVVNYILKKSHDNDRIPFIYKKDQVNALIYITLTKINLVIFHSEIIVYQSWDVSESIEDWEQINNKISALFTSITVNIYKLMMCGTHRHLSLLVNHLTQSLQVPVCFSNLFTYFKSVDDCDRKYFSADFLTACGLAMRENGAW